MGPIILFDKSILQALSVDESVWFDHFFLPNICPIFFVETLADLKKDSKSRRTAEEEVELIATRTPEKNSVPNVFHGELCLASLLGNNISMDGRPLLSGGKLVETNSHSGVVFDQQPEMKAFERWQGGKFFEAEKEFAGDWRRKTAGLDFDKIKKRLISIGVDLNECKNLNDAKKTAEFVAKECTKSENGMRFALTALGIPAKYEKTVFSRLRYFAFPPLSDFAPYANYVLVIRLFFYISLASGIIAEGKTTKQMDLAYLFYLPFCMAFTSYDRFHKQCAPLFLKEDQQFIWGGDLKEGLKEINQYYDELPNSEKEKGLYVFASRPPKDTKFFITRLWDKFLPRWRSPSKPIKQEDDKTRKELIKKLNEFGDGKPLKDEEVSFDVSAPPAMMIKRNVRKRKGKWWQLPKDLEIKNEAQKNKVEQ